MPLSKHHCAHNLVVISSHSSPPPGNPPKIGERISVPPPPCGHPGPALTLQRDTKLPKFNWRFGARVGWFVWFPAENGTGGGGAEYFFPLPLSARASLITSWWFLAGEWWVRPTKQQQQQKMVRKSKEDKPLAARASEGQSKNSHRKPGNGVLFIWDKRNDVPGAFSAGNCSSAGFFCCCCCCFSISNIYIYRLCAHDVFHCTIYIYI